MEVEGIVEQFFGEDAYKISPITNGLINSTFCVENLDTQKKYILQKINKQVLKNPNSLTFIFFTFLDIIRIGVKNFRNVGITKTLAHI